VAPQDWKLRRVPDDLRRRYVSDGWWPQETLGQRLARRLSEHHDQAFVIHSSTSPWRGTFGEVLEISRCVAGGLESLGVGPGEVVSFQTPNWIEGVTTFYGAAMLGAVVAPVVHIYGKKELGYILDACRPRVHVTATSFGQQNYLSNLAALGSPELPQIVVIAGQAPEGGVTFDDLASRAKIQSERSTDPSAPALVGWTSGTTSDPKGVIHSHETVLAEVRQLGETQAPNYRPSLMANPISHAIGMLGALLIPLDRGNAVHLLDVWDPSVVLDLMLEEDLTPIGGATYFLTSLLDHPKFGEMHLERMPYQGMGGAPIPRAVAERASALGINLYRMYGSTEQPSITGCTYTDPLEKRMSSDGRPRPGNEIRLIDDDGIDVKVGQPGEILSRGPELFLGYTDPGLTDEVIDGDGWYHTGDIGILDEDGYLCITDRTADVIIRGAENISAAEVEEVLMKMPGVAEVAVVAAPDPKFGEHSVCLIRPLGDDEAPNLETLRAHLAQVGLARQKWPEELLIVRDFPRTASGKIQKFVLRDQLRNT
jgi:acyl-CoA synthetase